MLPRKKTHFADRVSDESTPTPTLGKGTALGVSSSIPRIGISDSNNST